MRYQFIGEHRKVWPVSLMCDVLDVSRAGFYDWTNRKTSERSIKTAVLDKDILRVYHQHKQRYGSPRIADELQDQGIVCSEKRVAGRMSCLGIQAIQKKKFKITTDSDHNKPVAPDLLEQDFTASAANRKWVSDITYCWTKEGWLYLAVVMDLYSRAIIGWSMSNRMTQQLVCDALNMALFRRGFPKGTIIHSDRGSQYCAKKYQDLIKINGLRCSMGRKGTCYDNAAMESFFHTLKVEHVYRESYENREQAVQSIFEYIETYYNRLRKHSTIGNKTPMQFEELNQA